MRTKPDYRCRGKSMSLNEKQGDVLNKMAANEEMIGRLYQAYARQFPQYKGLWSDLANEEAKHASSVRELTYRTEDGSLVFNTDRFNAAAIQTFSTYLAGETASAQKQETPLINAINITLYIEESLIENKYFEVFKSDAAELKRLLENLGSDTKNHADRVRAVRNKIRSR